MITLRVDQELEIVRVETTDDRLTAHLSDGRAIAVPLAWFPRLLHGSPAERAIYEVGGGHGIHWPELDEDISLENLLEGRRSGESERSFQRWLAAYRERHRQSVS